MIATAIVEWILSAARVEQHTGQAEAAGKGHAHASGDGVRMRMKRSPRLPVSGGESNRLRVQGSRAEAKTLVPMRPRTSSTTPAAVFNVVFVFMATSLVITNGFDNHLCAPVRSTANKKATPKLKYVQGIEPCHPASLNPQASV